MNTNILPIVLISALDDCAASGIISELLGKSNGENTKAMCKTWRIENKYYTVNVLLQPLLDGNELDGSNIEAHIIYLDANECDSAICDSRYKTVENFINHNSVKLVAARCDVIPDSISTWAQDVHYEVIPLLEVGPEPEPNDPFPELYGIERLCSALHAHMWPGHVRLDRTNNTLMSADSDEEAAIERAEEFIETLAMLPAAIDLPLEERRQRAEELVTAFCKALGHDLFMDETGDR